MIAGRERRIIQAGWVLIASMSGIVAVYGWYYALRHLMRMQTMPVSCEADGSVLLIGHLFAVASALMVGPWQFLPAIRRSRRRVHRWTGRLYVGCTLTGGASGLALSLHAVEAAMASAGFGLLALGWTLTTALGYLKARRREFDIHRRWMIRSFALAFSAVTLRIYLPPLMMLTGDFESAQQWGAWLCWVPNLLAAELIIFQGRRRAYTEGAALG